MPQSPMRLCVISCHQHGLASSLPDNSKVVADYYHIEVSERGLTRVRMVSTPRQIAMYLAAAHRHAAE